MHKLKNCLEKLQHHKAMRHGHHASYLVYYGLALLEDHGVKFVIVCVVFTFHILATLTGEEA